MICAVCYSDSIDGLKEQAILAEKLGANLIEFRIDGLVNPNYSDIGKIISYFQTPTILTSRSQWKDITIDPPDEGRKELLEQLITQNPQYIDLEFPIDIPLISKIPENMKIILSLLDWDGLAKIALEEAIEIAKKHNNVIVKIVAKPNSVSDLKQLWKWSSILHKHHITNSIIGLGELGKITRIKSLEMKNAWMYGKIDKKLGEPFIPGMLSVQSLQSAFADDAWHLAALATNESNTQFCEPLFTEILRVAGLSGVFLNLPLKNRAELDQLLLWVNDGLLDGVKIIEPWKTEVTTKLDRLDISTIQTGETNCVVISKDGLVGYNTDVEAVKRLLQPYAIKNIKRVYIEGENNYARTLVVALKDTAELIVIRSKDENKLKILMEEFPMIVSAKESFTDHFDLVICNQYPETGFERISPLPPNKLRNARIVFDPLNINIGASETINIAKSLNIATISGIDFHLMSAIVSFELWTKKSVPMSQINLNVVLTQK